MKGSLKSYLITLVIGAVVGVVVTLTIVHFLKPKVKPGSVISVSTSSNTPGASAKDVSSELKMNRKVVTTSTTIEVDKAGEYVTTSVIDRKGLQYNHSIHTGVLLLNNSINLTLQYQYKKVSVTGLVGYGFDKEITFGVGLGYRLAEW